VRAGRPGDLPTSDGRTGDLPTSDGSGDLLPCELRAGPGRTGDVLRGRLLPDSGQA